MTIHKISAESNPQRDPQGSISQKARARVATVVYEQGETTSTADVGESSKTTGPDRIDEVEQLIRELGLDQLPFNPGQWEEKDRAALLSAEPHVIGLVRSSRNWQSFLTAISKLHPSMRMEEVIKVYGFVAHYFYAKNMVRHERDLARRLANR